jgi:hypothetical protein
MGTTSSLSGAIIESDGMVVCKYASDPKLWDRLNEQATYMADCGHPFVEVLGIAHGRYWLKQYNQLSISDLASQLRRAKKSLEPLWDPENPRYVDSNWQNVHALRVRELCRMNGIESLSIPLLKKFDEIKDISHRLTVCSATHGDATLSNVVIDNNEKMHWIDPIPPSLWLPAFKAVDLGKLLQSAHGWEHFINGRPPPPLCEDAVLENESAADVIAAQYFHALCYLRILRYAENNHREIYDYAINRFYDTIAP